MTIRPIHTDADHALALAEIERLWDAVPGTPGHDDLEVLGTLIAECEENRWPIDLPDPVEAIRFRMEQSGRTQADLATVLGSRSRASEVLARKRHLTVDMIWKLSREWQIPAESLIKSYDLQD